MALIKKISLGAPQKGAIISSKGSCCTETCKQDYFFVFRTDVVPGDFIQTISEIQGSIINGIERTFDAPVDITIDSGLKQLIKEVRFSLFMQYFSGDSLEVNVFDDDTYNFKAINSEAIFNAFVTDGGTIYFTNSSDAIEDKCDCNTPGPDPIEPEEPLLAPVKAMAYYEDSVDTIIMTLNTWRNLHVDPLTLISPDSSFSLVGNDLVYSGPNRWVNVLIQLNYQQVLNLNDLEMAIFVNGNPIAVKTYLDELNSFDTIECLGIIELHDGDIIRGQAQRINGVLSTTLSVYNYFISIF